MTKVFEPFWKRTKSTRRTKSERNIVITNADKGGAAVILDVKNYKKQCERQLNNTENCKHLQKDPAATNNELVRKVENEKLAQKNIASGLKVISLQTPQFHTQPKIQKEENPKNENE